MRDLHNFGHHLTPDPVPSLPVQCTAMVRDLIYDVGLHKGEDTAYYLALGYRVVAFEANAMLVEHCRRRFGEAISDGRLRIVEGAIDDSGAETVMFYSHVNTVWGTTDQRWVERNRWLGGSMGTPVSTVDFAAYIRETGMPFFMKVDIEGADRVCFEALRLFDERPVYVSVESEKVFFPSLLEEFSLLEDLGYDRFAVVQQAGIRDIAGAHRVDGSSVAYRFDRDASGPFGIDVGPWVCRDAAVAQYRQIFRLYRFLGDNALIRRSRVGRALRARAERLLARPLPGWYDTHAARSTNTAVNP